MGAVQIAALGNLDERFAAVPAHRGAEVAGAGLGVDEQRTLHGCGPLVLLPVASATALVVGCGVIPAAKPSSDVSDSVLSICDNGLTHRERRGWSVIDPSEITAARRALGRLLAKQRKAA